MINDIFRVFGAQTAEILFEIITECMDDYLYIFDLQNNTFEISQSAVKRFNMSKNVLTDAANEVMKVVYEEDRGLAPGIRSLTSISFFIKIITWRLIPLQ